MKLINSLKKNKFPNEDSRNERSEEPVHIKLNHDKKKFFPQEKLQTQMVSPINFIKHLRDKILILEKLFPKREEGTITE